jgi:hypothetical protein
VDRIATLRKVETALQSFERGEADLHETERAVLTALRTYASDFEPDDAAGADDDAGDGAGDRAAYRVAVRDDRPDDDASDDREGRRTETVVVATSPAAARELALEHLDVAPGATPRDVDAERL